VFLFAPVIEPAPRNEGLHFVNGMRSTGESTAPEGFKPGGRRPVKASPLELCKFETMNESPLVSIIGFGNIGATLSWMFLHDTATDWNINIMEPSKKRRGRVLDMMHASSLFPFRSITVNNKRRLEDSDFVVYCASGSVTISKDRNEVLGENVKIVKSVFSKIHFKNPDVRIIVISNPVDIIAFYISKFSNVDPYNIIGTGTYLDSIRLAYYTSLALKVQPSFVTAMVLGEHGNSMVPIYSRLQKNGRKISSNLLNYKLLTSKTKKAAFEIKKTENATIYGVSTCAYRIIQLLWHQPGPVLLPVSIKIDSFYKSKLGISTDLFLGLPVTFSDIGSPYEVTKVKLVNSEWEALRRSAKKIEKLILNK